MVKLWTIKKKIRSNTEHGGVKGLEFTFSHENTKITTNCWTTVNKMSWNPRKKIFPYSKSKKKPQQDAGGGVHLWDNQISNLPGGWPTSWKIITAQRFSHWSESSETPTKFSLASAGGAPLEHLSVKASRAWLQEFYRFEGNRNSTLEWHKEGFLCTSTQG